MVYNSGILHWSSLEERVVWRPERFCDGKICLNRQVFLLQSQPTWRVLVLFFKSSQAGEVIQGKLAVLLGEGRLGNTMNTFLLEKQRETRKFTYFEHVFEIFEKQRL